MPGGRKPRPFAVVDNKTNRYTKKEMEAREAAEPKGCADTLEPPEEIDGAALTEWKRVVKLYRELDSKILNDLDISTLAVYCESVAIYKKAQTEYKKGSLVIKDEGRIKENPYLKIMRLEGANIAKYAEQLCLSPVGRARMGVIAAKKEVEKDPLDNLLTLGRPE